MSIDFKTMEEKAKEEALNRDRQFSEGMQRMKENAMQKQRETLELWAESIRSNEDAEAAMQKEIAEIEAEAESRIEETRKKYAANYGRKGWNSSTEDALRDFVRGLEK